MRDQQLIGRDHPASLLRAAVERTVASHGGLALVTGEAGIGKTALVTDAAAQRRGDLLVAFATSWESEAVPDYWLWTQVLRTLRARLGEDAWRDLAPAPAVEALLGDASSPPAEFELFDGVTQLLIAASQRTPLLIVLDDLHFADAGSLELLKFACLHTWFERVLFVGTYRDSEIDPGHRLKARMLQLVSKAVVVSLDGLDETGVAALVKATVGAVPGPEEVAEITRRTGGNPFFVEQTAQLWASGQPVDATTAGMRDALRRRLDQLPPPLARMLTLAAVGGREFHPGVMAQASGIDRAAIETALDAACQTRLVRRERDRYVFVHDLVRETLYQSMDPAEAAHHHGCVVRALTADTALQQTMLTTEIAHHAWLAGDDLDPETAVEFLARAAAEANACLSVPGSEKYLRRALERCAPAMSRRRVLLLIELAAAVHWLDRADEARRLLDRALAEAEDAADPMLRVRVVMAEPQDERVDALARAKAEAYEALTGQAPDPALDHDELTRQLLIHFMVAAREARSDEDIAFGLWTTHAATWGPGTAVHRQALVDELAEVTRRTGDTDMRLLASSLRWVVLLEQGDPAYRDQLARFCVLAEQDDSDRWRGALHIDQAIIDIVQGRFDSAATRIEAAGAYIEDKPYRDLFAHLTWELALARGEAPEIPAVLRRSSFGTWHGDLLSGISALRRGDTAKARILHERLAAEAGAHGAWAGLLLRFQAELAVADGDAALAAAVRERLAPHPDEWLVAMWGNSVNGPVRHWLGTLDAAFGDRREAAAHFRAAAEQADRLDAAPWAAAARAALADLERPAAPAEGAVFRREGAAWTLAYDGATVHLPHAKGLADLHRLLQTPDREIPAAALLDPDAGTALAADARLGGDDLLDPQARARYREHLEALDERIDTAVALGRDDRAAALDAERQALIDQLKAATGLGGRARRLGDNHERTRKSVGNRIRNTLKRIEEVHPALAAHLRDTVATGSVCAYRPGPDAPAWRL